MKTLCGRLELCFSEMCVKFTLVFSAFFRSQILVETLSTGPKNLKNEQFKWLISLMRNVAIANNVTKQYYLFYFIVPRQWRLLIKKLTLFQMSAKTSRKRHSQNG